MTFPEWMPIKNIQNIFNVLSPHGECKLVGGCVRNIINQAGPTDIDIATTLLPDEVMDIATNAGMLCIATGVKYGTVTIVIDKEHFEITTLRKDVATDGRHAVVEFTDEWQEDAKRRDFTINAMYMDLSGNITDYFSSQQDLHDRIVKFVGDPRERIHEDHLRILRYFRFLSYMSDDGVHLHGSSFEAIKSLSHNIETLSGERIQTELFKILAHRNFSKIAPHMYAAGIFKALNLKFDDICIENKLFCNDPLVNLAYLFGKSVCSEDDLKEFANLLRLSNKNFDILNVLLFKCPPVIELRSIPALIYLYSKDVAKQMALLLMIDANVNADLILAIENSPVPIFPIKASDLMERGLAGKDIGIAMSRLKNIWCESDCELSKENLLKECGENNRRSSFQV